MNINIHIDINMNIDIPPPPHPMLGAPAGGRGGSMGWGGGVISIFILISIWIWILIFISLLIWIWISGIVLIVISYWCPIDTLFMPYWYVFLLVKYVIWGCEVSNLSKLLLSFAGDDAVVLGADLNTHFAPYNLCTEAQIAKHKDKSCNCHKLCYFGIKKKRCLFCYN